MYRDVLKNRHFLKLWGAQVASQVAAQLLNYSLVIRIYEIASGTRFANSSVSLFIVSIGLPAIFFAIPAGAYVDHMDRKRVLVWTNALRALLVPLFILLDTQIIAVYIVAFIISIFSQFFVPAEGAALPKIVHKDHILAANALFIFTLNASFIMGYSLAAPIIGNYGIHAVYIVVTLAFGIAWFLTLLLPKLPSTASDHVKLLSLFKSMRRTIKDHSVTIFKTKTLLFPILLISVAQTIVGIIAALAPALSQTLFNLSLDKTSHYLIIPAGIGLIAGSAFSGLILRKLNKVKVIYSVLFASAIGLISVPFLPLMPSQMVRPVLTGISTFGIGALGAIMVVSAQTLLQYASTDRLRGQIFGTLNMMINIAALAPVFIAGLLADIFSPTLVVGGLGVLIVGFGLFMQWKFFGITRQYS
ncbi:MFS transporter [Candidatus Saccharibacteria bacterium]|nr:MFS transporter [Candidatus Saccharibacteria bacterium]